MKKWKKRVLRCLAALLLFAVAVALWTVYDNSRAIVVRQEIAIEGLPESFDGYTFLQLSDLHDKYFGKEQKRLLQVIAGETYDAVLFTGDMGDGYMGVDAVWPLVDFFASERAPMYWVDGNWNPFALETSYGRLTGAPTELGEKLAAAGVQLLTEPVSIERLGDRIWLTPPLTLIDLTKEYPVNAEKEETLRAEAHGEKLLEMYRQLYGNGEIKIAVDHYPLQRYLAEIIKSHSQPLDYSLRISGHTHGGQIRLPFVGAVTIPVISTERGYLFPNQQDAKGLTDIAGVMQYTSAGLGASARVGWLRFRLFNPPEINVIVLRSK